MKLRNNFLFLVFSLFILTGCIKTSTKEIIMPDQEITGNQGYIQGSSPVVSKPQTPKKKKILDVEVEIPSLSKRSIRTGGDNELWGNQGYIYKRGERMKYIYIGPLQPKPKSKKGAEKVYEKKEMKSTPRIKKEEVLPERKITVQEYMEYKVRAGENLWSIAKKVYGDATKWTLIYEYNRDVLKDSQTIKPGMILKIPVAHRNMEFIK